MTGFEVYQERTKLMEEYEHTLYTMELVPRMREITLRLNELKKECPHKDDEVFFEIKNNICPYCGRRLSDG